MDLGIVMGMRIEVVCNSIGRRRHCRLVGLHILVEGRCVDCGGSSDILLV